MLDSEFTLYELKRALSGVKHTSAGINDICYEMIKQLSDFSLCMCQVSGLALLVFLSVLSSVFVLPSTWHPFFHGWSFVIFADLLSLLHFVRFLAVSDER